MGLLLTRKVNRSSFWEFHSTQSLSNFSPVALKRSGAVPVVKSTLPLLGVLMREVVD